MIDKFGRVMVYVKDPRAVADFWIDIIGFMELETTVRGNNIIAVEIAPSKSSDASIVFIKRSLVEKQSPELNLGTPSILFSSYDILKMRQNLQAQGVTVGDIMEIENTRTFHFADIEGNYFAVRQIEQ